MRQNETTIQTKMAAPVSSWFKASCVRAGEGWIYATPTSVRYCYRDLGHEWAEHIASEENGSMRFEQLYSQAEKPEDVLHWLEKYRSRHLALIPKRRRQVLAEGILEGIADV